MYECSSTIRGLESAFEPMSEKQICKIKKDRRGWFLKVPTSYKKKGKPSEIQRTSFTSEEEQYFFSLPTSIEKYIEYVLKDEALKDVFKKAIKVKQLNEGKLPFYESGLDKIIHDYNQNISFTTDIKESIINSDIIFIAVGTPTKKDGSSNLDFVFSVSESIGKYINTSSAILGIYWTA